jgi:hypothetical protein
MTQFFEILLLLLFSATKFLFAVGYMLTDKGYSYPFTVLILIIGGTLGVFIFTFFSEWLNKLINRFIKPKPSKKVFTRKNRFIVKIKSKYGLYGIAFLSPIVFSIPIGCFLASRFYSSHKKNITAMLVAVFFWSLVLPLIKVYW